MQVWAATETGISSRNKSKVKFNKKNLDGAKKTGNKQNTKGLCIEKKGNDWLKHYESQQKWGKHWCNLNKTAKTELWGNLQSSPRPGEHKHTREAVGSPLGVEGKRREPASPIISAARSRVFWTRALTGRKKQLHGVVIVLQGPFWGRVLSLVGVLPFPVTWVATPGTMERH